MKSEIDSNIYANLIKTEAFQIMKVGALAMMVRKLNVKHETTQVLKDSMDEISKNSAKRKMLLIIIQNNTKENKRLMRLTTLK